MTWNWALVIGGAVLILIEAALGGFAGFDLVLIGSTFMVGGGIGMWAGSTKVGLVVGSALAIVYVAVGRRYVRRRMHARLVHSNVDALLGREGVVLQRIALHEPGQVKVNDEVWRATPAAGVTGPLEPGSRVAVAGIDGVTLQVRESS